MFLSNQPNDKKEYYKKMLSIVGALSGLSSDSETPFFNYRTVENLFCKAFGAENLSRLDCSVDARHSGVGVGIKTFIANSLTQKIAEFNAERNLYSNLGTVGVVKKVSELRNERVLFTGRAYALREVMYHCVTRLPGSVSVYETGMDLIDIASIDVSHHTGNVIGFNDGKNEYSFNVSKSTLYKRFILGGAVLTSPVNIADDPFGLLERAFMELSVPALPERAAVLVQDTVILPLYSESNGVKTVPERSGLNQWNAGGRLRDSLEVYIRIPAWIHRAFLDFFPRRDEPFDLVLPNGNVLRAKVCQDESKALMSNPNNALGQWILRDVLGLKDGELLTYKRLQELGVDSVAIRKIGNGRYGIDFMGAGSFDDFEQQHEL